MRCPRCDYNIHGRALFCPNCGAKLEQPPEPQQAPTPQPVPWSAAPTAATEGKGSGLTWLVIGVALLVLLLIAALGYGAVQAGRRERVRQIEQTAEDLYRRGEGYLREGQLELAEAAYEQALLYVPDHEGANERLAQVRQELTVLPTPTAFLQQETKQAHWNELMAAYETRTWDLVIQAADKLIGVDPSFNRDQVDQMLVEAFYELGQSLVAEDKMIEAVRSFESALVIEPSNDRITLAKDLASSYMTGMGYWGADWEQTIAHLSTVYSLDPQYKDVAQRLYTASVQYGDLLILRQQWCEAAQQYTSALAVSSDPETVAKNQDATLKCAQTPTPGPEGEAPRTKPVPAGTYVGQVERVEPIASGKMYVRGHVLDSSQRGVAGVTVRIQAWDWSTTAITDGSGQFSFDGLGNAVVYTLTLPDLPSEPVDVEGEWGKLSWVEFVEVR